ncbi:methylenetetrahydrofolate reductase [NAD(P)H] [Limibaculum sp. FT325]|uniref:methylenetetrahydrofolate reductase [NAD(P)H] n=1 Tax=Thermohalobaculum sediminis TaxID=2939436 RepID=UPI0020BE400B|nr:methylenetetrahydrofolate reductase [NAD(P)H] [Limibaculum sediminis]MCL5775573.1 methylenetetrahydrofolate reductase [NAD(P)H] [Limibaculum sediminis]
MATSNPSPRISFEFFPPKTPRAAVQLWESVERLAPLAPAFVSVTYGAGGTTRDRTLAAILAIRERARLEVAGHLTCVGASRDEVLKVARGYAKLGCRRIVALRGDPPAGAGSFQPHPRGFAGSVELVEALAGTGQFEIWVGAYPEKHPEAADTRADIEHLKRKIDAGAAGAITQFFFENETFYRFRDACVAAGISAPILPGILPIDDFEKTAGFAARCGAHVPEWMHRAYGHAETDEAHDLLSVAIAAEQCDDLLANGVPHLHLYTLNKPELPWRVCRALGVEPHPMRMAASCG